MTNLKETLQQELDALQRLPVASLEDIAERLFYSVIAREVITFAALTNIRDQLQPLISSAGMRGTCTLDSMFTAYGDQLNYSAEDFNYIIMNSRFTELDKLDRYCVSGSRLIFKMGQTEDEARINFYDIYTTIKNSLGTNRGKLVEAVTGLALPSFNLPLRTPKKPGQDGVFETDVYFAGMKPDENLSGFFSAEVDNDRDRIYMKACCTAALSFLGVRTTADNLLSECRQYVENNLLVADTDPGPEFVPFPKESLDFQLNDDLVSYVVTGIGDIMSTFIEVPSIFDNLPVVGITDNAFKDVVRLASITLHENVKFIGEDAFAGCTNLEAVIFPSTLEAIGPGAFNGCTKLLETTLPTGITEIKANTFKGCELLATANLPSTLVTIGDNAFDGCAALDELQLPATVTTIGNSAFLNCSLIPELTLPESVRTIGSYAFAGCSYLLTAELNEGLQSIGAYSFNGCSSISTISVPDTLFTIGDHSFRGCTSLETIEVAEMNASYASADGMLWNRAKTILIVCPENKQGEITLPVGTIEVKEQAFMDCTGITLLEIPDTVLIMGSRAVENCSSIEITCEVAIQPLGWALDWNPSNCPVTWKKLYPTVGLEYSYNDNGDAYIFTGIGTATDDIVVLDEQYKSDLDSDFLPVIGIGDGALRGQDTITSIIIPDSVETVGQRAFQGCSALESISVPNTIKEFEGYLFFGCSTLESIVLPEQLERINAQVFDGCAELTSITIPASVLSIGTGAFLNCPQLTINCEIAEKPAGWNTNWNADNRPVNWGVGAEQPTEE